MKIGKKLMLSFIGIALLVGVVGYVGMTSLQKTKEINHKLSISIIPGTFEMYKIMSAIESLKTWTLVYILRGNIVRNGKTIKEWLQKDKDLIDETSRAHIENNFPLNTKQNYSREFEDKFKKLNTITNEIINLKNQGISVDELTKKMEKDYRPVYFPLLKLLKKHLAEHSQLQKEMESNLTKVFNRSVKIITITIFITLVLAIGTGLLISRSISRPILKLKTAAAEIGHGKLDTVIDIKSNDEIGILARSVEEMAANLSRTTTSVTNLENEITKRKKAQEQLEVFKYYFNSSIQGFGYATLDTKAILVNDTLLKLLSLNSKEDIIGKSFMLYYTDESKIKLENEVIPLILNEGSWSGELDMVQTTGKIIFTHESLFLIRDNEGNPNYIAVVITDITERKNYELKLQNNAEGEQAKNEELQTTNEELVKTYGELHESNEKYKLLSDAVAYSINAVAITDLSGKFTYINPSFEKMFGYSSNEAVDMTIPQFLPKKEFKKLTEEILPAVKKKGGYVGEIVCMKKDKSEFTVSSSTSLIKDINGKPTAMMGSFIDITEQKQAQKEAGETVVAVAAAEVERAKAKELGKAYIQLEKIQNANINITADLDRRRIAAISAAESEKKKGDAAVIMMTAFTVDDLVREALRDGVYAVLSKPLDIDRVVDTIERSKKGVFIAVVDDDPEICAMMKKNLEKNGYSVAVCATGEEAISLAAKKPQDILFINMELPILNGLEVYLEIIKINPKAVVVIMTSYRQEMDDLVNQTIKKGAYSCINKPFDMEKVLKIIEDISNKAEKNGK